jgi:hypothetical protein
VPDVDSEGRESDTVVRECGPQSAEHIGNVRAGGGNAVIYRGGVFDLSPGFEGQASSTLDRELHRTRRVAVSGPDTAIRSCQFVDHLEDPDSSGSSQEQPALRTPLSAENDGEELGLEADASQPSRSRRIWKCLQPRAMSRLIERDGS